MGSQRLFTRWTWTSAALSTSPSSYSRLLPTRSASNEGPPSAGVTWTSSPAILPTIVWKASPGPSQRLSKFDFQHVRVDVGLQGRPPGAVHRDCPGGLPDYRP